MSDIETLLRSFVETRRQREALQQEVAERTARLLTELKLGGHLNPPPKGQKSPYYDTASGVRVRLMEATKSRVWMKATDVKLLASIHAAPSRNLLTAKEILLKAAKFDSTLVNRQYAEGKLTEEQMQAVYKEPPTPVWRLSIRSINAPVGMED